MTAVITYVSLIALDCISVSPTLADFQRRLNLSDDDVANLKMALKAVADGKESELASLGIRPSTWNEISFMFAKLIKSGFVA